MPKQLESKPCTMCGDKVPKILRTDRKSFYYPKRCLQCKSKPSSPEITKRRREILNTVRITHQIGATRLQNCNGFIYRLVKVDKSRKWKYEHRLVVEADLGRKLSSNEIVHHINHDTLDNRLENLKLMAVGEHSRLHHSITSWSKKYDSCIECKTTERFHTANGRCYACYQRHKASLAGGWPKRKKVS